tara:strand:+ start:243 stop:371 length:129 start_codon:yes stop_codon:yes gene_type:complete
MRLRRRLFITRHPNRWGDILWAIAGLAAAFAIGYLIAKGFRP